MYYWESGTVWYGNSGWCINLGEMDAVLVSCVEKFFVFYNAVLCLHQCQHNHESLHVLCCPILRIVLRSYYHLKYTKIRLFIKNKLCMPHYTPVIFLNFFCRNHKHIQNVSENHGIIFYLYNIRQRYLFFTVLDVYIEM